MFNKVLIGGSILLGSILIVENYVVSSYAYVWMWYASTGTLVVAGIIVGVFLGYGLKGISGESTPSSYDDDSFDY